MLEILADLLVGIFSCMSRKFCMLFAFFLIVVHIKVLRLDEKPLMVFVMHLVLPISEILCIDCFRQPGSKKRCQQKNLPNFSDCPLRHFVFSERDHFSQLKTANRRSSGLIV